MCPLNGSCSYLGGDRGLDAKAFDAYDIDQDQKITRQEYKVT